MTFFELTNKSIKEMRRVIKWALKYAENKQSMKLTAKDEYGMQTLSRSTDLGDKEILELIDNESLKTLEIALRDVGGFGNRLIIQFDIKKNGDTYMIFFGLTEDYFDMLERHDCIKKCRAWDDFSGYT